MVATVALAAVIVYSSWLPRAPDLYAHLLWGWQVMRCLDHGQLPLWLPDLNAGFGSPGIRLYSPFGPSLTGGLGLLLGDAGRGLRAAALLAVAGIFVVSWRRGQEQPRGWRLATGLAVVVSPMAMYSIFGRTAWSEYLAIPCAWWVLERLVSGRVRAVPEGVAIAMLWLFHAPTAVMVAVVGSGSLALHRSREFTGQLLAAAAFAGGLSAWHWLPLLRESTIVDREAALTTGIFDPVRNLLGSESAFAWQHNIWLGWVAAGLLLSILATRGWRRHPRRVILGVFCVLLASPLSAPLWRLDTPFLWLQFPWRWLLPATLVLMPAVTESRRFRYCGMACILAPSLMMSWINWVQMPVVDESLEWEEAGGMVYNVLGGNPMLVDVPENRPPAFAELATNLEFFGAGENVVVSGNASVVAVHRWSPLERQVEVVGASPFAIGFRLLDYPFWSVTTVGSGDVEPGGMPGVVSCRLPAGSHRVGVSWVGDPLSSVGQIVAAVTLVVMVLGRRRWHGAMK